MTASTVLCMLSQYSQLFKIIISPLYVYMNIYMNISVIHFISLLLLLLHIHPLGELWRHIKNYFRWSQKRVPAHLTTQHCQHL